MDKHTAIYVRSSPARDCAGQEAALRRLSREQESEVLWYRDRQGGPARDRPGWSRLMKGVHAGAVSALVIWRLDRLGLTLRGLAAFVADLQRLSVRLIVLQDQIDSTIPSGQRWARLVIALATYETAIRTERIRAGQTEARARGSKFGRPAGTSTRIKVTPALAETICRLKAEGTTIAAIARRCGLSRPTIYNVLAHEYAGTAD